MKESTGGIQFAAAPPYTEAIEEVNGRKEAVSLDLEDEESAPEGSVNSGYYIFILSILY